MPADAAEQVLAFPAARLAGHPLAAGGFWADHGPLLTDLEPHFRFLPRAEAEVDPTWVQLVPYAVLQFGDLTFCYRRGGGNEARLRERWSLGVGGHVNPCDGPPGLAAVAAAGRREVLEEVEVAPGWSAKVVGLLYDPATPVGRVHLGVVSRMRLVFPDVTVKDAALVDAGLRTPAEVEALVDRMESWSALAWTALQQ